MRKKIAFLIILFLIPICVYAGEDDKLIYGIDKVNISSDTIDIEGWAYVDRVNSLGGKNFVVNLIAVRKSSLNNNIDNYRGNKND